MQQELLGIRYMEWEILISYGCKEQTGLILLF